MKKSDTPQVGPGERRNFFRVDDILPVIDKKIDLDISCIKARVLFGLQFPGEPAIYPENPPDPSVSPALWKILLDIHNKLNLVLDALHPEVQCLSQAKNTPVSLSASGLRFTTDSPYQMGDLLEVRILLHLQYPLWLVLYGHVVKKTSLSESLQDVAIRFCDMDEEIRDKISQYCLKRQREIIREQRKQEV